MIAGWGRRRWPFVVVHRQADLLEVVDALGAAGGLAGRLHGREQQRDQHAAGGRRADAGDRVARDETTPSRSETSAVDAGKSRGFSSSARGSLSGST